MYCIDKGDIKGAARRHRVPVDGAELWPGDARCPRRAEVCATEGRSEERQRLGALCRFSVFLCLFVSSYEPYGIPYGIPYGLDLFWRRLGPGSERGQPGASLHVPTAMCLCGHSQGKLPQGQQLRLLPPQASAKAKYLRQEAES